MVLQLFRLSLSSGLRHLVGGLAGLVRLVLEPSPQPPSPHPFLRCQQWNSSSGKTRLVRPRFRCLSSMSPQQKGTRPRWSGQPSRIKNKKGIGRGT